MLDDETGDGLLVCPSWDGCGLALCNVGVFTHDEASIMHGSQFELYIAWKHRKIVILHQQESMQHQDNKKLHRLASINIFGSYKSTVYYASMYTTTVQSS